MVDDHEADWACTAFGEGNCDFWGVVDLEAELAFELVPVSESDLGIDCFKLTVNRAGDWTALFCDEAFLNDWSAS